MLAVAVHIGGTRMIDNIIFGQALDQRGPFPH